MCSVGFFQALNGEKFLEVNNKYQKEHGENAPSCEQCIKGQYTDEEGKPSCKECIPGTFQDNIGQDNCTKCPAGWSTENTEQKDTAFSDKCVRCESGKSTKTSLGVPQCTTCRVLICWRIKNRRVD